MVENRQLFNTREFVCRTGIDLLYLLDFIDFTNPDGLIRGVSSHSCIEIIPICVLLRTCGLVKTDYRHFEIRNKYEPKLVFSILGNFRSIGIDPVIFLGRKFENRLAYHLNVSRTIFKIRFRLVQFNIIVDDFMSAKFSEAGLGGPKNSRQDGESDNMIHFSSEGGVFLFFGIFRYFSRNQKKSI